MTVKLFNVLSEVKKRTESNDGRIMWHNLKVESSADTRPALTISGYVSYQYCKTANACRGSVGHSELVANPEDIEMALHRVAARCGIRPEMAIDCFSRLSQETDTYPKQENSNETSV